MRRQRFQTGQIEKRGKGARQFWSARFRLYVKTGDSETSIRKPIKVGLCSEYTEAQAREDERWMRVKVLATTATGELTGMSHHVKGRVGELLVAIDLMKHGFEVFEHISEYTSCDMLAMRNGGIVRVEVKYAGLVNGQPMTRYADCAGKFDLAAIVSPDGSIEYRDPTGQSVGLNCPLLEGDIGKINQNVKEVLSLQ